MSSDIAISVEGLSKCYMVGHNAKASADDTLRDQIVRHARNLARKTRDMASGRAIVQGDTVEEFWALRDVSFEVPRGARVGILGRNGAGKSTLLKLLSRITEPTSGRVKINGRVASLLEVGTGFHPELTGRENVFLNGAILGMGRREIQSKFDEIVAFAEVERFLDTPVKRYSSGMYVRLAFAVAAHLEPEILIVDEVLAVGDAQFQNKCLGKMRSVADSGRTVLFVSHNLASIAALTSTCVLLTKGHVECLGDTGTVIERYLGGGLDPGLEYHRPASAAPADVAVESVTVTTSLPGNIQVNGDPFQIEVQVSQSRRVPRLCLSVQIYDPELTNHVHVWNYDLGGAHQGGGTRLTATCSMPKFRLYFGKYKLRIFLSEPPGGQLFETLDGICPFEVVMKEKSRLFQWWPKECSYLEDCQWKIHVSDRTFSPLEHAET
jgi:lipopolysaccharide transport system ATP-binding protein